MSVTEPVWLLNVPIHPVTRPEALQRVSEMVEQAALDGKPHLVITADASALVIARRDPEFLKLFQQASLVTADGAGVLKALRMKGANLKERCSGCDLAVDIAEAARDNEWRLFLLGAAPGVAERAAQALQQRFPGLQVVGVQDGYFTDDDAVVERIAALKPDILLIAMGMPRQEKWFWKHRERLGVKVAMGVGGTFDVLSGTVKRAPEFFQRHGLEWLYRLASNPKKMAKVALLPTFAALALAEISRRKHTPKSTR